MIKIKEKFPLKSYNSLLINKKARYFCEIGSIEDCREAVEFIKLKGLKTLMLGEGTNIILTEDFSGLVIKNNIKGKINKENIVIWSFLISLIFLILGILNSKILTPFNKVWFRFGIFLGNFISPIIMGIVFFLVVTPTGLIMKLFRKDLINLRKNNSSTYWIEKKDIKSSMKNQF